MKQLYPSLRIIAITRNAIFTKLLFSLILILIFTELRAQVLPELVFRNPVLESGTALQNGAKYRFANAAPNLDVIVEIKNRSASNVVINNIDLTSFGWDKAFQPELGIPGTVAPFQKWWVEFEASFVKTGTTTKIKVDKFDLTALDVDGDSWSIQEYVQMEKPKSVSYSTITQLITGSADAEVECGSCGKSSALEICGNCLGTGKNGLTACGNCGGSGKIHSECDHAWDGENNVMVQGPVTNFVNIDTLGTAVMATYNYESKDRIRFKIGAKSAVNSSSAGMRLNSLWFRSFNLAPQATLPVHLLAFNTKLDNKKAVITWASDAEINFSHYSIERSVNGTDYKQIAIVFPKENNVSRTDYEYVDNLSTASKGVIYYRLKMIDIDGKNKYSATRLIRISNDTKQALALVTYPNPVVNELQVTVPMTWQDKKVVFEVYNSNGHMVRRVVNNNASQTENISFKDIPVGLYIIKATEGSETAVQRIVKTK